MKPRANEKIVERVQTGVRIEKRILKVAKGLAEYLDMSLGDLLEGVLLNAFEGKAAFTPETLERIRMLKELYDLTLTASDAHQLLDEKDSRAAPMGGG